jgi:hypothetical protein
MDNPGRRAKEQPVHGVFRRVGGRRPCQDAGVEKKKGEEPANWICLGETKGRGRMDRYSERALTRKAIYAYPLRKDFRRVLCGELPPAVREDGQMDTHGKKNGPHRIPEQNHASCPSGRLFSCACMRLLPCAY